MVVSSLSTRPDQRLPRHLLKATSNIVSVVLTGILHDRMLSTARAGNEHESLEKNGEEHSGLKGKTIRALVCLIGQRWDRDGRLPESKAFLQFSSPSVETASSKNGAKWPRQAGRAGSTLHPPTPALYTQAVPAHSGHGRPAHCAWRRPPPQNLQADVLCCVETAPPRRRLDPPPGSARARGS